MDANICFGAPGLKADRPSASGQSLPYGVAYGQVHWPLKGKRHRRQLYIKHLGMAVRAVLAMLGGVWRQKTWRAGASGGRVATLVALAARGNRPMSAGPGGALHAKRSRSVGGLRFSALV